jgi:hypothetical protein
MKSTQATVQQRVEQVLQVRLSGGDFLAIRQYASAQGWGVSDRQLWRYSAAADALLDKNTEKDLGKLLNRHLAQRRDLYARCLAQNDLSNARGVLADEAKLLGLYDRSLLPAAALEGIDRPKDVTQLIAATLSEVRAGRLDSKAATTIAGLAGTLLRSMEVTELEERLAALEAAEAQRLAGHRNGRLP